VQAQMTRLIDWFNNNQNESDGLVRAALAHLWLEAIHPFEDGNGRVGRALVEMALAQDLKTDKRLWSLSQQMWLDRAGYYAQLQAATGQGNMDVTPWVQWFVGCVGPDGFVNGISTEKYVNLCRVSRATAYRELTALCEMGVLVQTGTGRGTRYRLMVA
jgi:Fic family protein